VLTVRDMVEETGVRVLAGADGLDRPVRWVHISEITDPTPWLSGGELLLTTGLGVVSGDGTGYVERLAAHGLAAVGVGTGVGGVEVVPPEMAEAAERLGFPLFEVPYEVPFIALTEKAFTHIVNEQAATLQRAVAANERLERIVLSERGLEGIAGTLAGLVEGAAAVFDARGSVLARRGLEDTAVAAAAGEVRRRAGAPPRGFAPNGPLAGRAIVLPVARTGAGDEPGGAQAWLLAARHEGPLTELDRLVVHHAVTVVALELLRRRVEADTERRLAGDVLASLLSGELEGPELRRRLQPFGLEDRVSALVLAPPRRLKDAVESALAGAARAEAGGGLAAGHGTLSCALLPVTGSERELFERAERVRAAVCEEVGTVLAAGAGRAVAPSDVRRGFHEARWALEAVTAEAGGDGEGPERGRLATYRDLGSFQLLLALQDDDALRLFCDSILSPIETGEGAYGGELMRSLEVFIECNGQWERAAKKLFCHRHTLRYRVRRIEELTGRSLDSARDRIDFWLALRGRELLQ
jgi:purine catabolism regulatory family protein/PucR-like helix-turn-helix protein